MFVDGCADSFNQIVIALVYCAATLGLKGQKCAGSDVLGAQGLRMVEYAP